MRRRGWHATPAFRRLLVLLVLLGTVAGCTYDDREPGLFGRIQPTPSSPAETPSDDPGPTSTSPPQPVPPADPDLPVVGEAVWTSGDGLDVTVRIAVHAVRRIPGATVLDWSVTPLSAPGLTTGDRVPPAFNLGLTRFEEGNTNVFLLDGAGGRLYRPLTYRGSGMPACLCTPVWLDQSDLRIGHTTVFQVAYPPLPTQLDSIDVDIASVPPFANVPVNAIGTVPFATRVTELARPAAPAEPLSVTTTFDYPQGHQLFSIGVNAVYRARDFSAVSWSISSVSSGAGLDNATQPPIADQAAPRVSYNRTSAGGPQLSVPGLDDVLRARQATTRLAGHGEQECLCTDLRLWAGALRDAGSSISLVTVLPPVPASARGVDVVLPGLTTIGGIRPLAAPDATYSSARVESRATTTWTYREERPQAGWSPDAWPTPTPDPTQLHRFRATVDTVVR